jgi:hypothetical protein
VNGNSVITSEDDKLIITPVEPLVDAA